MTNNEAKHIKVPIWLATILIAAMLAIVGDMWRKVNTIESDLKCLKTALQVKGVLDPKVCTYVPVTSKLLLSGGQKQNQAY
jgi:hypothetical protein